VTNQQYTHALAALRRITEAALDNARRINAVLRALRDAEDEPPAPSLTEEDVNAMAEEAGQ
jgi:serine/threonine protein phosphatase PrpC